MVGYEGEKMSKSKGNLVLVSRLREAGVDPMAIRLALLAPPLPHRLGVDRRRPRPAAEERLAAWRTAVAVGLARRRPRTLVATRSAPRSPTTSTPRRALAAVGRLGRRPAAPGDGVAGAADARRATCSTPGSAIAL